MRGSVSGVLVVCCLKVKTQLFFFLGLPTLYFKVFLRYTGQFIFPALQEICSETLLEKLSKFVMEFITYLAVVVEEGDKACALEASVLFLSKIKEFPLTFVSVFPSGEMEPLF